MSYSHYRVVELLLDAARPRPEQIEAGLNHLSSEGWRVVGLEVIPCLALQGPRVRVMVEQVEDEAELEPVA